MTWCRDNPMREGQKFGKLTVLSHYNSTYTNFKCECGNIIGEDNELVFGGYVTECSPCIWKRQRIESNILWRFWYWITCRT